MTAAEVLVKIEALMQLNDGHITMNEVMPLKIAHAVDKHGRTMILGTVDISDMYSITRDHRGNEVFDHARPQRQ
jgi:hypothetical protein